MTQIAVSFKCYGQPNFAAEAFELEQQYGYQVVWIDVPNNYLLDEGTKINLVYLALI